MDELRPLSPEEIRRFRSNLGITQDELAASLGVGLRTVGGLGSGSTKSPPLLRLAFAALARKIDPWLPELLMASSVSEGDVRRIIGRLFAQRGDDHAAELAAQFASVRRRSAAKKGPGSRQEQL